MLDWLQTWFEKSCDGEWEHGAGITIENLDNPGWHVRIVLPATSRVADRAADRDFGESNWFRCSVTDGVFEAFGDPGKLQSMLETFKSWIEPDS